VKSFHLLLLTLVTTGNDGSRRVACSAVHRLAQWHCVAIGWGHGWGHHNRGWLAGQF